MLIQKGTEYSADIGTKQLYNICITQVNVTYKTLEYKNNWFKNKHRKFEKNGKFASFLACLLV